MTHTIIFNVSLLKNDFQKIIWKNEKMNQG